MKKKRIYKIVVSFLIAGLLFAGMLLFEESKKPEIVMKTVVVANQDIAEGVRLTEQNIDNYLTEMSVDEKMCCGDNLTDSKALLGKKTKVTLKKDSVLQNGWFLNADSVKEKMKEPVTVTVRSEDLSEVVGGSLRSGDFIDLNFLQEETGTASLIFRGVLVEKVYDSSGKEVEKGEEDRAASMLTLLLEEDDVEELCELMAAGRFRMAKTKDREVPYEKLEAEVQVSVGDETQEP